MPCVSGLARPLLLARLDILIDDPSPPCTPNAKVIGEPGTVGRALACGANYLITCFSHSGWIASNNFHFKRHSRVSNRLPMGPFVDVPPQTGGNDSAAMQLKHYLQLK